MFPQTFSLHPTQENIFYDQALTPLSTRYNVGAYTLAKHIDPLILQHVWSLLVANLDALRLTFNVSSDGEVRQILSPEIGDDTVHIVDFSASSTPKADAELWLSEDMAQPFDYLGDNLHQLTLIRLDNHTSYLFIKLHHLICDGTGMYQLQQYLHQLYQDIVDQQNHEWLSDIPQYQPVAERARQYLDSPRYEKDQAHWAAFFQKHEMTCLSARYLKKGSHYSTQALPEAFKHAMQDYCERHGVTVQAMLFGAVSVVLSQMNGQTELCFSTVTHGRQGRQGMQVVGMHSNEYPVAITVTPEAASLDYIRDCMRTLNSALRHCRYPAAHLSRLARDYGGALPNVTVNYEAFGKESSGHQRTRVYEQGISQALLLRLKDYDRDSPFVLSAHVLDAFFTPEESQTLIARVVKVLTTFVENHAKPVGEIDLVSGDEKHTLLTIFNQTEVPYPKDQSLAALFEAQVARTPDNIALVFEGQSLTYGELNSKANQLARQIRLVYRETHQAALPADTLVALYFDRSPEMVISILAVLKAGAAYVPISPEYPTERSTFILGDTRAPLVITHASQREKVEALVSTGQDARMILADSVALQGMPDGNLDNGPLPEDLAYVIYTSGTTGQPKGVMVAHQSAENTLRSMKAVYDFDLSGSRVSCFSQYTFDVSVSEMLNSLLFGGELHLLGESCRRDPHVLSAYIDSQALNILYVPPVVLAALPQKQHDSLKTILFAGESCDPEACLYWHQHYALYNFYGPTEASIYAAGKLTERRNLNEIGQPISNTQLYVLDDHQQLLPQGAVGELYIGGA
ncbi:AMP-binding protein, partial [Photobacterium sp. 1_MG-2023]|uniref:non-ribosomal peptide synthetase n=1 Tax=Photobacterium sp. 1_MG-2023 TaxID=3062646 RepID=UPI0026E32AFB